MTRKELRAYRHPYEDTAFWISMIVIVPMALIAIAVLYFTYGLILLWAAVIVALVWFVLRIQTAVYQGNMVQVSTLNFPEIQGMIANKQAFFGYTKPVAAYVVDEGKYNAFIVPLLRRKVILLDAALLEDPERRDEIEWIIGRFVGALAARHYRFTMVEWFLSTLERAFIFNLLLYPYERAVQYSGDQLGLVSMGGRTEVAVRAMCKLMAGGAVGEQVSPDGIIAQHASMKGSFFGWLAHALSPHPHMAARLVNLLRFSAGAFPERTGPLLTRLRPESREVMLAA